MENISKQEILTLLGDSSIYGNLGLFIGAGFTKAVLDDAHEDIALSWGDLIEEVSGKLQVDCTILEKVGKSYPEIVSQICDVKSRKDSCEYKDVVREFKTAVSNLTGWYPSTESRMTFGKHLKNIQPAWIITTNYDLTIESLLTGHYVSLNPEMPLVSPIKFVPVYHLHGIRTNPDSIIITQQAIFLEVIDVTGVLVFHL